MRVAHIAGVENKIADALSRSRIEEARALCHNGTFKHTDPPKRPITFDYNTTNNKNNVDDAAIQGTLQGF